jgi:4-methylaminobutanoate oxidase (formaldehyde-forming)
VTRAESHPVKDLGYRAINSLRLEEHYMVWGSDITQDYNPYEAGLGLCVAADKGEFLAGAALVEVKARGPNTRSRSWASAIPPCATRVRCTIPTASVSLPETHCN